MRLDRKTCMSEYLQYSNGTLKEQKELESGRDPTMDGSVTFRLVHFRLSSLLSSSFSSSSFLSSNLWSK